MKILLCADLHLNSKMNDLQNTATKRKQELLSTFKSIIACADKENAEAIVIAGDLFDTDNTADKILTFVADCIRSSPHIDFYLISGNHDSRAVLRLAQKKCDNLHLFADSWESYEKNGVRFTGRSRLCPEMYGELDLTSELYNVVVLHGQETFSISHTPDSVVIPLLENKGVDLLALGHIHYFHSYPLGEKGVACYPGCPEGRGFDECGDKGIVIIDTALKGEQSLKFVKLARRTLHSVSVDIDEKDITLKDYEDKISSAVEGISEEDMVKVTLRGSFCAEAHKDISYLEQGLLDRFYYARIKDSTTLYVDTAAYAGDISLKGEFIRLLSELDEEPGFIREVAECGIKALRGEDVE